MGLKSAERYISEEQVLNQAERFFRSKHGSVRRVRITHISHNVRNPNEAHWPIWGTRMMKVWAEAQVSSSKYAQHRGVGAQLQVYVSLDGSKLGHSGVDSIPKPHGKARGPRIHLDPWAGWDRLHIAACFAGAKGFVGVELRQHLSQVHYYVPHT